MKKRSKRYKDLLKTANQKNKKFQVKEALDLIKKIAVLNLMSR